MVLIKINKPYSDWEGWWVWGDLKYSSEILMLQKNKVGEEKSFLGSLLAPEKRLNTILNNQAEVKSKR